MFCAMCGKTFMPLAPSQRVCQIRCGRLLMEREYRMARSPSPAWESIKEALRVTRATVLRMRDEGRAKQMELTGGG